MTNLAVTVYFLTITNYAPVFDGDLYRRQIVEQKRAKITADGKQYDVLLEESEKPRYVTATLTFTNSFLVATNRHRINR